MRKLVYTMFISNNCPSFHLWWKENLVKHWKVSKYYKTNCRIKFMIVAPVKLLISEVSQLTIKRNTWHIQDFLKAVGSNIRDLLFLMVLLLPLVHISIEIYFLKLILSLLSQFMFPQCKLPHCAPEYCSPYYFLHVKAKGEFIFKSFYRKPSTCLQTVKFTGP